MLFFILLLFCTALPAMDCKLPSEQKDLTEAERVYYELLESKYKKYFEILLCSEFARSNPYDSEITPIINRFEQAVLYRALLLHNPHTVKNFCRLFKNKKTKLNAYDYIYVDRSNADEALRSVLADRRLITFIAKGEKYNGPLLVRPQWDQHWKMLREEMAEITSEEINEKSSSNSMSYREVLFSS